MCYFIKYSFLLICLFWYLIFIRILKTIIWILRKFFVTYLYIAHLSVRVGYDLYINVSNKHIIVFFVSLDDNILFYVLQSCSLIITSRPTCLFKTSKTNCYKYIKLTLPELLSRDWKLLDRRLHITNIQR